MDTPPLSHAPDLRDYLVRAGITLAIAFVFALILGFAGHRSTGMALPLGSLLLLGNMLAFRRLVSKAVARAAGQEGRGGAGLGLKLVATLLLFGVALKYLDAAGMVIGYVGSLLVFSLSFAVRPPSAH